MPPAAHQLVRLAARLLPKGQRARYREEWLEQVETLASSGRPLSALVWAIGTIPGSSRMTLGGQRGRLAVKRAIDVVLSVTILAVVFPMMLLFALATRITSPGPVMYRAPRIGKDGRPFALLKFRTMTPLATDAHGSSREIPDQADATSKTLANVKVTAVGYLLQRTSLDETPQLVNVLRGEMSLVGPRPVPPDLFAKGDERIRRRTLVRPGITGLGQVAGRADMDFVDHLNRDLEYVHKWSLWLDFKLMVRTVLAPFKGRT